MLLNSQQKGTSPMTNLNRITILGNTGKDQPRTAATANGKQVTRLTVATNKRMKDSESGEWTTDAVWHKVVVMWNWKPRFNPEKLHFVFLLKPVLVV